MARYQQLWAARRAVMLTALVTALAATASLGSFVNSALAASPGPAPARHASARTAPAGAVSAGSTAAHPVRARWAPEVWASSGTAAPVLTPTFPVSRHDYRAAGWLRGCRPAGICGHAAALAGLRGVLVGIYRQSSRRYWNGSSFSSRSLVLLTATGTASWHYPFTPPHKGWYTVLVRAAGRRGARLTRLTTVSFGYRVARPAAPVIVAHPPKYTRATSAEFGFISDLRQAARFSCTLDGRPAVPCDGHRRHRGGLLTGGKRYNFLPPGRHCFGVRTVSRAGIAGPAARYCWFIVPAQHSSFLVGGDLTAPLFPGTSEPLDLTFTNPGSVPLYLASGAVSARNISIASSVPGCASSNFAVAQGLTGTVTVPARQLTPVSLAELKIPQADWPVITMIDTSTNQDACEAARLTLIYTGIEAAG